MPETIAGAPCWIDLLTADAGWSRKFYGELFGWTAGEASPEFGGYFMFMRDGAPVAGAMPKSADMGQIPDQWGCYLAVDDIGARVELARGAGAGIRQEPMQIADLGWSAIVTDPGGAQVGLWQAESFAGFGNAGAGTPAGAPAYFELHTRDYDPSVAFYRDVLGWDARSRQEVPGLRYTTLGDGDAPAGIMDATDFLGDGESPSWSVYFATDDTDDSAERVSALGGALVMPPLDTPFGRMAVVTDPGGAEFRLMGPAAG